MSNSNAKFNCNQFYVKSLYIILFFVNYVPPLICFYDMTQILFYVFLLTFCMLYVYLVRSSNSYIKKMYILKTLEISPESKINRFIYLFQLKFKVQKRLLAELKHTTNNYLLHLISKKKINYVERQKISNVLVTSRQGENRNVKIMAICSISAST